MTKNNNSENSVVSSYFSYLDHLISELEKPKNDNLNNTYFQNMESQSRLEIFLNSLPMFILALQRSDLEADKKDKISSLFQNIILYHYTTYEALEKIITGKSFKLSNITSMNDKKECQALYEYWKQRKQEFKEKESIQMQLEGQEAKKIEEFKEEAVENLEKFEKKYNYYTSKIFSFSFSALKDDAAQWERYGVKKDINATKAPCGICIGIPIKKLLNLANNLKEKHNNFDLVSVRPVLYVPNYDKENSMLEIMSRFAVLLGDKKEKNGEKKDLIKEICQCSAAIKHESFKREYEIRLLVALNLPDIVKINGSILLELENYDFNDLFSSITLGPEVPEDIKTKVEKLLRNNNINLTPEKITFSDCPIRSFYN